jgi:hypothetical protein
LKTFGHIIRRGGKGPFASRVREAIEGNAALSAIIEPLLISWQALRDQAALYDREITMKAKSDAAARRLMTVPGIPCCGPSQGPRSGHRGADLSDAMLRLLPDRGKNHDLAGAASSAEDPT